MSLLKVQELSKHYGEVQVLRGVSFEIGHGERRAIIGPNGAGKTTLFNIISGVTRADGGTIAFDGHRLDGLAPEAVWRCGLARTFQRNNLFFALSVEENVRLAVQAAHPARFAMLRPAERYRDVEEGIARVLDTMDLREVRRRPVGALSYGDQRKLEVALALACDPKLLLLDEPTAGMSPAETASILHYLDSLPRTISLVIIEHDMDIVFSLAERILVLNFGEVLADGVPEEIHKDERVQAAYLGVG